MYLRIYKQKMVQVYEEEDLRNSEIIGKIKGRYALGFSIREDGQIIYYDIGEISAKELQLIIRHTKTVTIAIEMLEDEIVDYFYDLISRLCLDKPESCCDEESIDECIIQEIDSGIVKSQAFYDIRPKVIDRLRESDIFGDI